ncbi:MAG TPA: butyrate kinase [Bacteroidales bacterium]|nr:butyrate kinase [Bacteroidales bacterium]HPT02037.1 butyrate kinase [Bacteroidales bacterium]
MDDFRILAINPGSTSTKIAVFHNANPLFVKNITHSAEELAPFEHIADQFSFRKEIIYRELQNADIQLDLIRAIVGRGGMLKPIASGVYEVNDAMKNDLHFHPIKEHASNLGGLIADEIARSLPDAKAYIADPVVVDELDDIARVSGHPAFKRISIFHALNQKSIARQHAKSIMKRYEDMNLIVVHMGGGVTVGAHEKGKVIDVNQGLDGEGPFSPERSGTLPSGDLARLCFSGKYTEKEVLKMIVGNGGIVAHLGTNSVYEAEQRAMNGDEKARFILEAFAYQVSKAVGSMVPVLKGHVDAILLTGGVAHSKWITNLILERVYSFAPVYIYPGEDEMRALALNGLMVLKGEIEPKVYA